MVETSPLYKELRQDINATYEVQIVRGPINYGMDKIRSCVIKHDLFSGNGPQIGGTISSRCDLAVMEAARNWPRMASFEVRVRLTNGEKISEWISFGMFYTDERFEDNGILSITAFDGMLLLEESWTDKVSEQSLPSVWPITAKAAADLLVEASHVQYDNSLPLDDSYAWFGLDTTSTVRESWANIAAAMGGNCILTRDGKIKIVPLNAVDDGSSAVATVAIAGIAIVGTDMTEQEKAIDRIDLGFKVQSFDDADSFLPVTGVEITNIAGDKASAGTRTGYRILANCEFSDSNVAELCLSKVQGYVYRPYTAGRANLDPAADLGDIVIVRNQKYQIFTTTWTLGKFIDCDLSAPYEQEVDHEYAIDSESAKTLRKAMSSTDEKLKAYPTTIQMNTAIEQTASSIRTTVSQTYVTITNYEKTIQDLQEQINGTVNTFSGPDVPTLNNYPAVDWESASERGQHVGSLYLVTSDGGSEMAGQYYRFEQSGDSFAWVLVEDTALAAALKAAQEAKLAAEQAIEDAETAARAAENAQGTADQAKLDAVAEAAKAQAAAQAAAALDAANRVNEALEQAKAYAEKQVTDFIHGEYADDIADITGQLDRKIETYYQTADPSLSWAEEEKANHFGDLWYSMGDQLYYRWDGSSWKEMTANPPQKVFDTLDGKARVFVSTPVPPYSVGDIWTQGPNGDILRCVRNRAEGELYVTSEDWVLASKYTDDSNLEAFISGKFAEMVDAIKNQIDQKAETYYQATDPSIDEDGKTRWNTVAGVAIAGLAIVGSTYGGHTGDLWYNTTDDTTWYWDGTQWVEQTISREVFDTIDGKAQIFVSQPTKDDDYYEPGDIWVNATYSDGNVSYNNDILRCINPKAKGTAFSIGDWQLASKYTDDSALTNFVNSVYNPAIESIGIELDGKVDTYFYGYEPTEENLPYSKWIEDGVNLDDHVDDIFYNTATGFAYRFTKSGNTYAWVRIKDSDITAAMNAAGKAQDTADGKRRVFVTQPTDAQAYDEGDLWVNAEYGTTYTNELLRCKKAKKAGTAFNISDWERASKYTDDSALDTFLKDTYAGDLSEVRGQIDQKIETWYQNSDPSTAWTTPALKSSHVGDLWYNTASGVNTTSRWDGTQWVQQNAPKAVFDQIDGKAQIFTTKPEPPYNVGDLWVEGPNGDIYKCKTAKSSGSYTATDWEKASKYTDDSALTTFLNGYTGTLTTIRGQIDQKAETWYQATDPSTAWTTAPLKAEHEGDLWYYTGTTTSTREQNMTYRWDGTTWVKQDAPKAVFDQIDGKAKIFVSQPEPPYQEGDLWVQGASGDILRCKAGVERQTGSFVAADWELASKYTDDSSLNTFLNGTYASDLQNVRGQIDQKIETWYQNADPSTAWTTDALKSSHVGDLWYNTANGVNTTSRWNGTQWVQQDAPKAVFDQIDGKAQVFTSQPAPPYSVGDLWVEGPTGDIYRCKSSRSSGSYTATDWEKASKYTDDSALMNFVNSVYNPAIESIGTELDGKVDTYFYAYEPTAQNLPYSKWIEDSVNLDDHVDDIFYNTATGFAYRFAKSGSTYAWTRIKDSDITAAMNAAGKAQDTADGKRRVFVAQPTDAQAYDVGDLWVNAQYGTTYSNDLLRCKKAKNAGTAFSINDWEKASKYTDDSALDTFLKDTYAGDLSEVRGQIDQKIETWYQNSDPSTAWTTPALKSSHVGDLWYNTASGVNTTSRWDGTQWVQQNAPKAVFDQIDGKAQIFTTKPEPPYNVGDLWVEGPNGDIYKCKTAKSSGSYTATDWEKASKYTDDSALDTFLNGYTGTLTTIRGQIDQKAQTWYQSTDPSTAWDNATLKAEHEGDLWYYTGTTTSKLAQNATYRWNGSAWEQQDAPKAVFDAIDGKRQIFTSQPTDADEYEEGDLWVNATYESTYSNDLLRCKTGKAKGTAFKIAHWELASKYTDDTAVENLKIGGRNLVLKTGEKKEATATSANSVYTGYYYFSEYGQAILTGNTTDYITVSFDYSVKNATPSSTTAVRLFPQINGAMGSAPAVNVSGNEIGHYEETFKLNTAQSTYSNSYRIRFRLQYSVVGAHIEISNLSVEKGTKATTWTAAPEDTDSLINDWIENIGEQIDGKAETFYQNTDPSTNWTAEQKPNHKGDLWFDTSSQLTYIWNGNSWDDMTTEIPQEVFDEIDGKAQIFITQPVPPYNVGDLWFESESAGIRTCITPKGDNGIFSIDDWQERNKYTDDTAANNVMSAVNDLDLEYRTFKSEIEQTVEDVSIVITQTNEDLSELKMHYRFDADGETIGKSDSSKTMVLSNEGIDMMSDGEKIVTINQNELFAPRKVNVPVGGTLQIGNYIWKPRSGGNMSLIWVGE